MVNGLLQEWVPNSTWDCHPRHAKTISCPAFNLKGHMSMAHTSARCYNLSGVEDSMSALLLASGVCGGQTNLCD